MNRLLAVACCLAFVLAGCAGLLPTADNRTESRWSSFADAHQAFERITPNQTSAMELKELGFDPSTNPNIRILTHADIIRRLIPNAPIGEERLAPGLRACLGVQDECVAYELVYQKINRKRYGNFWLDFLNFRRKVEITGWRFNAVVLLKNGVVVYKLWGGQPEVREFEDSRNPLGPLQGIGESVRP